MDTALFGTTRKRGKWAFSGAEALLDGLIVSPGLAKLLAGRNRPDRRARKRPQFFDGGDSFPSGHATGSLALAAVVAVPNIAISALVPSGRLWTWRDWSATARFAAQRALCFGYRSPAARWDGSLEGCVYKTHMDHAIHRHWLEHSRAIVPQFQPGARVSTDYLYELWRLIPSGAYILSALRRSTSKRNSSPAITRASSVPWRAYRRWSAHSSCPTPLWL